MDGARTSRLTPWVGRLLMLNAAGLVLLGSVLTAPRFFNALRFDPVTFLARPWTAVTHLFVHEGLLHFALTSLVLFLFGPPLERSLGGRRFVAYYVYCGVGAALLAVGLSPLLDVPPFVGASGALFGVLLGFVATNPDAEVTLFPLPAPVTARSLLSIAITVDVVGAVVGGTAGVDTGIAHVAHIGGVLAGYVFFRLQALTVRRPVPRPATVVRRPVVTPMRVQDTVPELQPAVPAADPEPAGPNDAEVDRVLDKISQFGIDSLTLQERKFLSDVAERKRRERS
jgi:membrane associated rhomboid family serine protease